MNKKLTITFFALMFIAMISKAQVLPVIPNFGFENWKNMGTYNVPDSWGTLNTYTSIFSVYTCDKGAPGSPGSNYLKLTSKTVGSAVVPGVAVSGTFDSVTYQPKTGFKCTGRPKGLTGKWQHMIFGSSQGFIDVQLTRWDIGTNSRVTVGSGHVTLVGMDMSWADFALPITYTDSNSPDTCIITLSASGNNPTNQDYLWVDNLKFSEMTSGVTDNAFAGKIHVSPNPVQEELTVDLSVLNGQLVSLEILDMQGRLVRKMEGVNASSNMVVETGDLSSGTYILTILAKDAVLTQKIIKE